MAASAEEFPINQQIGELLNDDMWFTNHLGHSVAIVETGEVYSTETEKEDNLLWLMDIMHSDKRITFFNVNETSRKRFCN